uniref:Uncharacterized protein n=1 Tax=Arion vulgaris TaxID=1028688 RepID=A0A0B7BWE8_9EUPU
MFVYRRENISQGETAEILQMEDAKKRDKNIFKSKQGFSNKIRRELIVNSTIEF